MSLKEEYILYLCERTTYEPFNSGIQRVTRLLASSMISNGVKLVPVGFSGDKVYILGDSQLETLSLFNGPKKDSWYIPNIENWDDFCSNSLCFFSPELNSGPTKQEYSSIMLNFF